MIDGGSGMFTVSWTYKLGGRGVGTVGADGGLMTREVRQWASNSMRHHPADWRRGAWH